MKRAASAIAAVEALLLVWLVFAYYDPGTDFDVVIPLFLAVSIAVGWLLASRVPGNPIGWLLLAIAGLFVFGVPIGALGSALLGVRPGVAAWLLWYGGDREDSWVWLPPIGLLFTQVLLLFPDGRLPSRGWRPFQRFTIAVLVAATAAFAMVRTDVAPGLPNPIGWIDPTNSALAVAVFLPLLASFLGSAYSLAWRFRRAGQLQRTQIKWVVLAASFVVVLYSVSLPVQVEAVFVLVGASYSLIPLSIGVAVLKYRLYDIDRIVSRTVSYAVVTSVVLSTYALVVTSVSRALPDSGALPVAGATLVAAGVFRPVLRRVRDRVDRRFDRARFDGVRAAEAFAGRLSSVVDPDAVAADLAGTVRATLAPRSVGVWLAGGR